MKLVKLNCQNCDATLNVDLDDLIIFCPYCGQKLMIDMDNIEDVFTEKEKTKREQERTKRKQMEFEYKEKEEKKKIKLLFLLLLITFGWMFFSMIALLFMEIWEKHEHKINQEIQVTISSSEMKKLDYTDARKILESDGFTDIWVTPANDIFWGLLADEKQVKTVTINGNGNFYSGTWFPKDATVRITYHSKK